MSNSDEKLNKIEGELSKVLTLLESVAVTTQKNTSQIEKIDSKIEQMDSIINRVDTKIDDLRSDFNRNSLSALDKYATKEVTDRHSVLLGELPRIGNLEIRVATLEKLSGRD